MHGRAARQVRTERTRMGPARNAQEARRLRVRGHACTAVLGASLSAASNNDGGVRGCGEAAKPVAIPLTGAASIDVEGLLPCMQYAPIYVCMPVAPSGLDQWEKDGCL